MGAPEDAGKKPGTSGTLYVQVLTAIGVGIAVGYALPADDHPKAAEAMRMTAEAFVRLIKMLVAPIVFSTVSVGIAGMGDLKKASRVGAKAILYFEVMTTVALALGVAVVHLAHPGRGMHARVDPAEVAKLDDTLAKAGGPHGLGEHLLAIVPSSFASPFVSGDVLQVLFVAVLTGVVLTRLPAATKAKAFEALETIGAVFFGMVTIVMRAAPVGAFAAMAFVVSKYGFGAVASLGRLLVAFYATALVFVVGVLGAVARMAGIAPFAFFRYLRDEIAIVIGTSSSESALPRLMTKLEDMGCARDVVRLVVPTGYSFNLDGTCIYLTMASLFVAEALDVPLTLGQELELLGVLLLTSKGAAGVTGSGFVTLSATLGATGTVPASGASLLLGIDKFMSEVRAVTNFVGNAVATVVVSRWEGALDLEKANKTLEGA